MILNLKCHSKTSAVKSIIKNEKRKYIHSNYIIHSNYSICYFSNLIYLIKKLVCVTPSVSGINGIPSNSVKLLRFYIYSLYLIVHNNPYMSNTGNLIPMDKSTYYNSDGSDGSIRQASPPSEKRFSDGK